MENTNKDKSYSRAQKYDLDQFSKFLPGVAYKSDVFKGKYFNIVGICLDDGYEIPAHHKPYDVFFYVISGRGIFTAGETQ